MAGGMHPVRASYRGLPPLPSEQPPQSSARHCWVTNPPDHPGRWPGLLVEWRRGDAGGWEGRVLYALESCLVEAWLPHYQLAAA